MEAKVPSGSTHHSFLAMCSHPCGGLGTVAYLVVSCRGLPLTSHCLKEEKAKGCICVLFSTEFPEWPFTT